MIERAERSGATVRLKTTAWGLWGETVAISENDATSSSIEAGRSRTICVKSESSVSGFAMSIRPSQMDLPAATEWDWDSVELVVSWMNSTLHPS